MSNFKACRILFYLESLNIYLGTVKIHYSIRFFIKFSYFIDFSIQFLDEASHFLNLDFLLFVINLSLSIMSHLYL